MTEEEKELASSFQEEETSRGILREEAHREVPREEEMTDEVPQETFRRVPDAKGAPGREVVRHFKRLGRELAMQFLYQCEIAGEEDIAENLANFWNQAELSGKFVEGRIFRKARAYAEKLISGVLEKKDRIDSLLEKFSRQWDISRMPVVDKNIMRVAIFELENCPDIPAVVSIDEAIEIAKEFGSERSGLFINGILNSVKGELPPGSKNPTPPRKAGKAGNPRRNADPHGDKH